jgi:hypothetical protein
MKFKKFPADARIRHGTSAHEINPQIICPRRRLTCSGNSAIKSFAAEMEFAEIFTPSEARAKEKAPKKRQARLDQWLISTIGSQGMVAVL